MSLETKQVKHNFSLEELQKIRQFLDTNPGMFSAVTGRAKPGRKAGGKNKGMDEGTVIEVAEPIENVIEITPEEAKKLTKQKRKPRNLTDEQKEKMREALARGRAVLAERRAQNPKKTKVEKEPVELPGPKPKIVKKLPPNYVGEVQTKRYVVKSKPKKITKQESDSDDTSEEEVDIPIETTESESEGTILKKITKKTKAIKKVNELLEKQPIIPKYDIFRRR